MHYGAKSLCQFAYITDLGKAKETQSFYSLCVNQSAQVFRKMYSMLS